MSYFFKWMLFPNYYVSVFRGDSSKIKLVNRKPNNYQSCERKTSLPEPDKKNLEMNRFIKLIEFYFRIPVIKFVSSMVSLL